MWTLLDDLMVPVSQTATVTYEDLVKKRSAAQRKRASELSAKNRDNPRATRLPPSRVLQYAPGRKLLHYRDAENDVCVFSTAEMLKL